MESVKRGIGNILDFFWPRRCEICGGAADRPSRYVCSECLMRIPFIRAEGCCKICGTPVEAYKGEFTCETCRRDKSRGYDKAVSAARMEGDARTLLLDFKYNSRLWLANDFADWMEAALSARIDPSAIDLVLPVPASFLHRLDRGYDQCAILARNLAARLDRKYRSDTLSRKGHPKRQSNLSEEERRENVKGTFAALKPQFLCGRTILLVDDVMTTGSTLSECASTLKKAGAYRVVCLTLARAVRY